MKYRAFLIIPVLAILTSCTASPVHKVAQDPLPQLTFEHLVDIPVRVSKINITSDTQRGAQAWDIANTMTTPPDIAMRRYLNERFKAAGADGVLNINLAKADVYYAEVPNSNKLLSYIPFADEHEHTFEIVVNLQSQYLSGTPDSTSAMRFVRRIKLPPHVTMGYREAMLQRALEELIADIDEAISLKLVQELRLVNQTDLPTSKMEIKTKLPEIETIYSKPGAVVANPVNENTNWTTTRDTNP